VSGFARLIPLLTIIVTLFAVFQLFTAIVHLTHREYIGAALNFVFSFAGFALGRALWTNRRKFM
jgi:hypothetical protein